MIPSPNLKQIENVQAKRFRNGMCEYLVKYKSQDKNGWVLELNIENGREVIDQFETELFKKTKIGMANGIGSKSNLEFEKFVTARKSSTGSLEFLVKWKNVDKLEAVPAIRANVKWPQEVIKFYESRIKFD